MLHNGIVIQHLLKSEEEMLALGEELSHKFQAGDLVLLQGELGAGKTTLVRGILKGLGWKDGVRSPTFTIMQEYKTTPPVLHADFYRLDSIAGLGLEEYFEDYLCLIEWPEKAGDSLFSDKHIFIHIEFTDEGRMVTLTDK